MRRFALVPLSLLLTLASLQACGRTPFAGAPTKGSVTVRAKLAARTTGVVITFAKPALRPLPDKATDLEATAERTAIVIQANREGAPVAGLRLRLQAGFA